jgi:hypothetical protein
MDGLDSAVIASTEQPIQRFAVSLLNSQASPIADVNSMPATITLKTAIACSPPKIFAIAMKPGVTGV